MSKAPAAQAAHEDLSPPLALLDAVDDTPGAAELRPRSYELLGAASGTRLLGAGCGGGRAVGETARLGARATGIDPDKRMIEVARARWPDGDFTVADACALPFPEASMDAYRAEKMYHELPSPSTAVAEAHRVLAAGGRIALIGQDWDTLVIDSDDATLTRTIVHARAGQVAGPRAARRYRNLLRDAGFDDVRVEVRTAVFTDGMVLPMLTGLAEASRAAGAVTAAEAESWVAEQRQRAAAGRTFVAVPFFTAAGTRPS
ncbi:methyltransferase domain-containing protein [Streptomyces sp. ISL-100]|uniref:methyltransferase domain-containing protein n=1 Tax=Streptomyces sp. ISL-100 TaxID=2819173 RepID=UPI001BEB6B8D|nr:methyltransferase domain-containing protein [Streptomyces sp. ISL-100]MBT2394910.1 methyltransferase domain-containing protein [Streptomyces sp. ISL-100]